MDKPESGQQASNSGPARRSPEEFFSPDASDVREPPAETPSRHISEGAKERNERRNRAPGKNKRNKIMRELLAEDSVSAEPRVAPGENAPAASIPSSPIAVRLGAEENSILPEARLPLLPQEAATANLSSGLIARGIGYHVAELRFITTSFAAVLQHSWLVRAQASIGLVEITTNHALMHWELAGRHMADIGSIARRFLAR